MIILNQNRIYQAIHVRVRAPRCLIIIVIMIDICVIRRCARDLSILTGAPLHCRDLMTGRTGVRWTDAAAELFVVVVAGRSVGGGSLAADRHQVGVKRKNGVGRPGAAHLGAVATAAPGSAPRRGDLGSARAHQWTTTGGGGDSG